MYFTCPGCEKGAVNDCGNWVIGEVCGVCQNTGKSGETKERVTSQCALCLKYFCMDCIHKWLFDSWQN